MITYADVMQIDSLDGVKIKFTVREYDVLSWIATGKTKAEIADTLAVSESALNGIAKIFSENWEQVT